MELGLNPALERLKTSSSVLIAGAGGGFDIFCGLPLLFWLEKQGIQVTLANLSFTDLNQVHDPWLFPATKRIHADSQSDQPYFPEKHLCRWFADQGRPRAIYGFARTGAQRLRVAYQEIVERHEIDAVVLVDGGTDSLLRGDEERLGTPNEDMLTLAAVHGLEGPQKILVSLGFGIDAYHGVCHAHVLESVAELMAEGSYLGSLGLVAEMPEAQAYVQALDFVCSQPGQWESIVNASIAAALEGKFGGVDPTGRTDGATYWINPLMTQYWFFEADTVAKRILFLPSLESTETFLEVRAAVLQFRLSIKERRNRYSIPH